MITFSSLPALLAGKQASPVRFGPLVLSAFSLPLKFIQLNISISNVIFVIFFSTNLDSRTSRLYMKS